MENPRFVVGATNNSYNNQNTPNNQTYDDNDLYEYDADAPKGISGRVKGFLGSVQLKTDEDSHSTHQYKRDIIESLCSQINQTLLIPKAFYFFFFAAFGSLFPLMAIYFKQMAMSPVQVGILFGFRPFVEFLSVPFWANVGERWKKGKIILIGSLICWIVFTLGLGFIKPPVHSCLMHNETHIFLEKSKTGKISQPASNKIVSGGHSVVNKRYAYDNYEYKNGYEQGSSSNDLALNSAFGLIIRKKRDENAVKSFKYVNVTEIRRIRKTTTTATAPVVISTNTLGTISSSKVTKERKGKSGTSPKPAQNQDEVTDEIEFSLKNPKTKKTTTVSSSTTEKIKTILNEAIDEAQNEVIEKSQSSTDESEKSEKGFKEEINKALKESISTSTIKTTQKRITQPPIASTSVQYIQKYVKPVEKTHYFDSDPLDTTKNRTKTIYVNESTLRLVKPSLQTSIVYHKNDVHKVFIVFLVFILAGEFFSAPAITLADTCTLKYLGQSRADLYGRQRMFGSLGWALAMFSVGILLDHSKAFTDHPCGKAGPDERNYSVCFAIYSVLMGCALIIATQFKFDYGDSEQIPLKSMTQSIKAKVNKARGEKYQQFDRKQFVNESDDEEDEQQYQQPDQNWGSEIRPQVKQNSEFKAIGEEHVEDKQKYKRLFEICKTWKHVTFLFVVWFMGIGVGLVFTFLFWHLQDLGGTPALYGIASVINHMSELMAYFFVHQLVKKFGHIKIIYAGLIGNAIRFVYVSLLTEPYWILPFEFIQGITHALVWATATSYFAQSVPDDLRSSAQGLLQGIHFGLGRGCGAVLGGVLITSFGTKVTFAVYGVLCLLTMIAFSVINYFTLSLAAKQNPDYTPNQLVNEENQNSGFENNEQIFNQAEIQTAVNPMMVDTNYYYQPSSSNQNPHDSQLNQTSKSSFPIAPHGVPATNPNWSKQFSNNKNY